MTKRFLVVCICGMLASVAGCAQDRKRGASSGDRDAPPQARDAAEKRILETAAQVERHLSVPMEDGRLIRMLAESIGAKRALEIGSSTGYSGLWFALALRTTGGKLTTLEIDPGRAAMARENFGKAGVGHLITVIEGDAHDTIQKVNGPLDIVFIDADKPGYRDYLEKVLPLVRPGGLILAHNIRTAADNPAYMDLACGDAKLETLLVNRQMAVTLKKRELTSTRQ
jgi:caffeoyl-CoA O-methyltransferase